MGNGISFRGALGGYNKKDVNEYITKADRDFAEYKAAAEEEKAKLEAEAKKAAQELSELKKQLEEAKAECESARDANASLSSKLEEAESRNGELEKEISEKNTAISGSDAVIETLKAEKAVSDRMLDDANARIAEMTAAEEKKSEELYESISDKLNTLLDAANGKAEEIVTGAMNRSDEIIEEAKRRADEIVLKASSQAEGLNEKSVENMRQAAKSIAAEYCDEVTQFATELRDSFNALLRDISAKGMEMSGKLDYLSASVGREAEKRIIDVAAENLLDTTGSEKEAAKPKTSAQAALEAINERIDSFVKSAVAAIGRITKRGKN